jgi:hypothetical protein
LRREQIFPYPQYFFLNLRAIFWDSALIWSLCILTFSEYIECPLELNLYEFCINTHYIKVALCVFVCTHVCIRTCVHHCVRILSIHSQSVEENLVASKVILLTSFRGTMFIWLWDEKFFSTHSLVLHWWCSAILQPDSTSPLSVFMVEFISISPVTSPVKTETY